MSCVRTCAVAVGVCLGLGASAPLGSAGLSGKYAVREIEYALALHPPGSRVRLTLVTGQSLDVTLEDRESAERVLTMVGAVAQGAQLAVRVEEGEVRAILVAARERPR